MGPKVAYAGGVALICVANSKIRAMFDDMWIFPSPGDAGSFTRLYTGTHKTKDKV